MVPGWEVSVGQFPPMSASGCDHSATFAVKKKLPHLRSFVLDHTNRSGSPSGALAFRRYVVTGRTKVAVIGVSIGGRSGDDAARAGRSGSARRESPPSARTGSSPAA